VASALAEVARAAQFSDEPSERSLPTGAPPAQGRPPPRGEKGEEDEWTMDKWVDSTASLKHVIATALSAPLLARHPGHKLPRATAVNFVKALGRAFKEEECDARAGVVGDIKALLQQGEVLEKLAGAIAEAAAKFDRQAAATAHDLHDKFMHAARVEPTHLLASPPRLLIRRLTLRTSLQARRRCLSALVWRPAHVQQGAGGDGRPARDRHGGGHAARAHQVPRLAGDTRTASMRTRHNDSAWKSMAWLPARRRRSPRRTMTRRRRAKRLQRESNSHSPDPARPPC
jgi:hypothetical protein